jgi:hypothetical protein
VETDESSLPLRCDQCSQNHPVGKCDGSQSIATFVLCHSGINSPPTFTISLHFWHHRTTGSEPQSNTVMSDYCACDMYVSFRLVTTPFEVSSLMNPEAQIHQSLVAHFVARFN